MLAERNKLEKTLDEVYVEMIERTAGVDAQIAKLRDDYLNSHKKLLENVNRLIEISLKLTNKVLTLEERLDK